jgi:hypothetical protein
MDYDLPLHQIAVELNEALERQFGRVDVGRDAGAGPLSRGCLSNLDVLDKQTAVLNVALLGVTEHCYDGNSVARLEAAAMRSSGGRLRIGHRSPIARA